MKTRLFLLIAFAGCGVEVNGPLMVTSISPLRGSARGGQTAKIEGAGFDKKATVKVGGLEARVLEATSTELKLIMPRGVAGLAKVEVSLGDRQSALDGGFTYERLAFELVDAAEQRVPAWPLEGGGIATADVQGDGDLDVFQAARGEGVSVYINDGLGGFQEHVRVSVPLADVWSVVAADFSGDGVVDLFLGTTGKTRSQVLLGEGAAEFTPSPDALPALFGTAQVATPLDLEPDGDLDLIVTGSATTQAGTPVVMVLVNDGRGHFRDASERLPGTPLAATGITAGDLDRDGDIDLFFSMDAESNRLFLGDGRGAFQRAAGDALPHDLEPRAGRAALGDLNEDGFPDLFVPTATQDRVFINDGTAHFADLTEAFLGPESSVGLAARLVDLDLDGHLDVALVERPGRVRLLRNDGAGRLFDYSAEAVGNDAKLSVADVAVADFDLDGVPELFVSRAGLSRPSLFVLTLPGELDSDGDRWPDRFDTCPLRPVASKARAPFGCRSAAECRAQTGCDLHVLGASAYLSCAVTSTWAEAGERCAANGGRLVEIADVAENDFLRTKLSVPAWIGLDDKTVEGTWSWQSASAVWFNWAMGQPDNSNNEDCASIMVNGAWNDLPCAGQAAALCETRREQPIDPSACLSADGGL
ncbi:MAG: FG-GAP-like repeat-containing protein [Archangium sp.]|nr:FG-GAP-like repeat-containing protein [Archangium sp.]MDP3153321.1 FG-GAP-like repeat-containing protein [Archangium sp.]MDP3573387.1 FG-GAP-like repeat-containing protein [Archangium sp.]